MFSRRRYKCRVEVTHKTRDKYEPDKSLTSLLPVETKTLEFGEDLRRNQKHNSKQVPRDKPLLLFKIPEKIMNQTIGEAVYCYQNRFLKK